MATHQVVFTPRARIDALQASRWIADRSPSAAARWYSGLEGAIAKLNKLPDRHPVAEEESEQFGVVIRQMIYGRKPATYRILFSVVAETVYVLGVRHGARGPIE